MNEICDSAAEELFSKKIINVLNMCYEKIELTFILPICLKNVIFLNEISFVPEAEKLIEFCKEYIDKPIKNENKNILDCSEVINCIEYWHGHHLSDIWKKTTKIPKVGRELLREMQIFIKQYTESIDPENAIAIKIMDNNKNDLKHLQNKLQKMKISTRCGINDILDSSEQKMEEMHSSHEKQTISCNQKLDQCCKQLQAIRLKCKIEESGNRKMTMELKQKLKNTIDRYDTKVGGIGREIFKTDDKLKYETHRCNLLQQKFDEQANFFNIINEANEKIIAEKLKAFIENRSARIIQKAYRDSKLKKRKKRARGLKKSGRGKKRVTSKKRVTPKKRVKPKKG